MSIICQSFEETIWEHARTGAQLSAQAQSHIERCENCAQALREAKQIMNAVLSADCVPYAPDCRQAVMARIAPPARRPRLAWAYACAGLAFAGISALAIVNVFTNTAVMKATAPQIAAKPVIEQPSDIISKDGFKPYAPTFSAKTEAHNKPYRIPVVHKMPKRTNDAPYMVAKLPDSPSAIMREFETADYRVIAPTTAGHTMHFSTSADKSDSFAVDSLPGSSVTVAKGNFQFDGADSFAAIKDKAIGADYAKKDMMADSTAALDGAVGGLSDMKLTASYADTAKPVIGTIFRSRADITTERPVAIAVVHWSTPVDTPDNSYSYNYSDKDTTTGEVTKCSVKRTGDTVEIRLESEPEIKHPSERGSIYYEILAKV